MSINEAMRLVLIENTNKLDIRKVFGDGCIIVEEGERFSIQKDGFHYTINLQQDETYNKLLDKLKSEHIIIKECFHIFSGKDKEEKIESGYLSIFRLLKAFMKKGQKYPVKIGYIFEGISPEYFAVSGFLKTLLNESTNFTACTVQLEHFMQLQENPNILKEIMENDFHEVQEFRYTWGKKQVRKISEMPKEQTSKSIFIKKNGVYLITGGAGGLGLVFARHIIEQGGEAVVLSGRSVLSEEKMQSIQSMETEWGKVEYIQADISKQLSVEQLVEQIRRKYGKITGVIHAAGVIRDNFIMRQSVEELEEVLKPKVYGTRYLDETLKGENLDFFVMFSSISSILGTVGQGAYAYANSYMNSFAEKRRKLVVMGLRFGKSISINWPLWNGVGMQVDEKINARFIEKLGIVPLEIEEGMKAFDDALEHADGQVFIVTGDKNKSNQALGIDRVAYESDKGNVSSSLAKNTEIEADSEAIKPTAVYLLKEILSEQIGLSVDKIKENQLLDKYGIDSVMILEMTDVLENKFGKLSKTLFFEYKTINDLANYFVEKHSVQIKRLIQKIDKNIQNESIEKQKEPDRLLAKSDIIQKLNKQIQEEDEIAIIGIAGRYPEAESLNEFWDNIKNGKNCITEIPANRWDKEKYATDKKEIGGKKIYSKWGGFLKDIDCFDNKFFSIASREAENMDPQERLFLENVWETVENAGYTKEKLEDSTVGVYVGVMYGHYQLFGTEEIEKENYVIPNSTFASIANRVSYFFDFKGPSIALDTMCSSSLAALHLAITSLKSGESDYAIAGGVNLSIHPYKYVQLCQGKFLSEDGQCRSFGEGGTGYVPGEGVGSVLLKPFSKAKRDGDYIYGIVKGSAMNHGGRTNGYTVPNPAAQSSLIKMAMKQAKVTPEEVSYIEAHGTGTSLGDPIEITGLNHAFDIEHNHVQCAIGSVKSNIGHLESAAGIAAVTKVLLQMHYKKLVPSLHADVLNPNIDFDDTPFKVQRELSDWNPAGKRIAGISAFGAGGANVHVILEEYEKEEEKTIDMQEELILLSAKNEKQLDLYIEKIIQFLNENQDIPFSVLAKNLQVARKAMEERVAVIATDRTDLLDKLKRLTDSDTLLKQCYRSNKKELESIRSNEATESFINREYTQAAQMWVQGKEPDWKKVYKGSRIEKIPLPVHPFLKKHFWVQRKEQDSFGKKKLSPMLDTIEQRKSVGEGLTYRNTFQRDFWLLSQHVVEENEILPGAAYVEMAYEALADIVETSKYVLKKICWHRPFVVTSEKNIYLSLKQRETGFAIEFSSEEENEIYADGYFKKKETVDEPSERSLLEMQPGSRSVKESREVYRDFTACGIHYGNDFQMIQKLYLGEAEVLAKVEFTEKVKREWNNYILHPLLVDAALQTLAGFESVSNELFLPYSIEKLEIIHEISGKMTICAHKKSETVFDIDLADELGKICIRLKSVVVRRWKNNAKKELGTYLFPGWEKISVKENKDEKTIGHHAIITSEESMKFVEQLEQTLYGDVTKIILSDKNSQKERNIEYVDYRNIGDIQHSMEKLDIIENVYAVFGLQEHETEYRIQKQKFKAELYVKTLFHLMKAVPNKKGIKVHIITSNTFKVNGEEKLNPDAGAVFALAKSISKEYRNMEIHCIDLDWSECLTEEDKKKQIALVKNTVSDEITVRDLECYKRAMYPVKLVKSSEKTTFRKQGVYIIIGGIGGIGYELAKHLLRQYKANVVLVGRRMQDIQIEHKLDDLKTFGGNAVYQSADITNYKDVEDLVQEIESMYGNINGVIHSALVLEDRLFGNMTEETLMKVLNPKVKGLLNLYEVLQDEKLDFLLLFSSVEAYSSSLGQANYAGASLFEDVYAEYLQQHAAFDVKVLNWGYWGSVGVVSGKQYRERMEQQGVYSIEADDGIRAIEKLLESSVSHILYLKSDQNILEEINTKFENEIEEYSCAFNVGKTAGFAEHWKWYQNSEAEKKIFYDYQKIEKYCCLQLMDFFCQSGLYELLTKGITKEEIADSLNMIPKYSRLIDTMLLLLNKDGWLKTEGEHYVVTKNWPAREILVQEIQKQKDTEQEMKYYRELADTCMDSLGKVISGEVNYTNVMFPDNSMHLVENIYRNNYQADYFNIIVAKNIAETVRERIAQDCNARITVLEIGSGTGGTSKFVLQELQQYAKNVTYVYTDLSVSFLKFGREEFGSVYDFMEFKLLNVEKEMKSQGFEKGSADIVFASNVLHATCNLSNTLSHVKEILKKEGMLVINEAASLQYFTTLTFGLTDGWWYYEDEGDRIKGAPVLSLSKWQKILSQNGFLQIEPYYYENEKQEIPQLVITAYSDGLNMNRSVHDKTKEAVRVSEEKISMKKEGNKDKLQDTLCIKLETYCKEVFAKVLRTEVEDIETDEQFEAYGIDSLIIMEIMNELERDFGILNASLLFEYETIEQLCEYFTREHGEKVRKLLGVEAVQDREKSLMEAEHREEDDDLIDSMSESEIDLLIRMITKEN